MSSREGKHPVLSDFLDSISWRVDEDPSQAEWSYTGPIDLTKEFDAKAIENVLVVPFKPNDYKMIAIKVPEFMEDVDLLYPDEEDNYMSVKLKGNSPQGVSLGALLNSLYDIYRQVDRDNLTLAEKRDDHVFFQGLRKMSNGRIQLSLGS